MLSKIIDMIRAFFAFLFGRKRKEESTATGYGNLEPVDLERPFTLREGIDPADPMLAEIMQRDLQGLSSPLALMKKYHEILNTSSSHGNIDDKLDKLFAAGRTPKHMDGYYHGITLSLKTGAASNRMIDKVRDLFGEGVEIDPLQIIYGRLLSTKSPWAGKHFREMNTEKLEALTDGAETGEETAYLGINAFRRARNDTINNLAGEVLSAIIDMDEVPGPEASGRSWIYAKGGLFIARKQRSVDPDAPSREVMALNYRWTNLGNKLPNRLLIDELVEIAEGLYLGKLFYATSLSRIMDPYDRGVDVEKYEYRGFGYFLLMNDTWLHEKNMLFPELTYRMADDLPKKFKTLHLSDCPESNTLQQTVGEKKTVLHYLQELSKGVAEGSDTEARYFDALARLFRCAAKCERMPEFLHGGVVAFKSNGLFEKLGSNLLNDLWPAVRPFSPWSGKTFTPTTIEALRKYIGEDASFYENADNLTLGANTYRKDIDLSLGVTAFVERLGAIGMQVEYPKEDEADDDIFVKSFYFIAKDTPSLHPPTGGRTVLQLNYRWPNLHTMPPDNLCMDELVALADGLYLGQMLYAVKPEIPYHPDTDPKVYEYLNFGYFMLMDDDWWAVKEFISV